MVRGVCRARACGGTLRHTRSDHQQSRARSSSRSRHSCRPSRPGLDVRTRFRGTRGLPCLFLHRHRWRFGRHCGFAAALHRLAGGSGAPRRLTRRSLPWRLPSLLNAAARSDPMSSPVHVVKKPGQPSDSARGAPYTAGASRAAKSGACTELTTNPLVRSFALGATDPGFGAGCAVDAREATHRLSSASRDPRPRGPGVALARGANIRAPGRRRAARRRGYGWSRGARSRHGFARRQWPRDSPTSPHRSTGRLSNS